MPRVGITTKRLLLVIGDILVFQIALLFTLFLRYGALSETTWRLHRLPFGIVTALWILGLYVAGLYDLSAIRNDIKFFRHYLEGMFANLAVAFAFFYLIPVFGIAPRTNLFLYFAMTLVLGYAWRLLFNQRIAGALFRNRLLYVGASKDLPKIQALLSQGSIGFELVDSMMTDDIARLNERALEDRVRTGEIDTILLGHRVEDVPGLREAMYRTLFTSVALLDRTGLEEVVTGRVPLEYVSQNWFLEHLRENEKAWYEMAKRIADIIIGVPFALLTIVLYPFLALVIKSSSKGSVLYSQLRVGKMGRSFRIWKFRTMRADAEVAGKPQWATKDDPRITGVGAFLRATRLDELPQIWNVLRGDMSLIGPRPERPEFVDQLTEQMPFYALRHLTRPGLTGWAQIKFPYAGNVEDNLKKLQYDLFYIKHRSLLLDAAILLKTIGIVLRRQGT